MGETDQPPTPGEPSLLPIEPAARACDGPGRPMLRRDGLRKAFGTRVAVGGEVGRRAVDRHRGDPRQGRDRVRAPGPRDLPGPERPREPAVLRPAPAHGRQGAGPARRRGAGPHRPRRPGEGSDRQLLGRDETPPQHRDRPISSPEAARA